MNIKEFKKKYSISEDNSEIDTDLIRVAADSEHLERVDKFLQEFKEKYGAKYYTVPEEYYSMYVCTRIVNPFGVLYNQKDKEKNEVGSIVTKSVLETLSKQRWQFTIVKEITFYDLVHKFHQTETTKLYYNSKRKAIDTVNCFLKKFRIAYEKPIL